MNKSVFFMIFCCLFFSFSNSFADPNNFQNNQPYRYPMRRYNRLNGFICDEFGKHLAPVGKILVNEEKFDSANKEDLFSHIYLSIFKLDKGENIDLDMLSKEVSAYINFFGVDRMITHVISYLQKQK